MEENTEWRRFEEARVYAQSLGLSTMRQWFTWAKSPNRPRDIPYAPQQVYRDLGWKGFGDWLGTGAVGTKKRVFRPFNEARAWAHSLHLSRQDDWHDYVSSHQLPQDIPTNPQQVYKEQGWKGFWDFLGTSARRLNWMSFVEARTYARPLGLKSTADWKAWAKTSARPDDIPVKPDKVYREWAGWPDFLGYHFAWDRLAMIAFLRDILPILPSLQPLEIYLLLRVSGIVRTGGDQPFERLLDSMARLPGMQNPQDSAREMLAILEQAKSTAEAATALTPWSLCSQARHTVEADGSPAEILSAVDTAAYKFEAVAESLVVSALAKLWRHALASDSIARVINEISAHTGGEYAKRVRSRFLEQYVAVKEMTIPRAYHPSIGAAERHPNLMQRLVAHRLKTEHRIGNWCGAGAGKTLSAILASRVVDAHLTVVVAANNTLDGWQREIRSAFPDSVVLVKDRGPLTIDPTAYTYVLLNYEAFQLRDSTDIAERLVADHDIEMVVLDEVHNIKERDRAETKRRAVLRSLLHSASEKNPDLYVLGMSATPVINSLDEGRSILEMILGEELSGIGTQPTIDNAIALHQKFVLHGVRYKPDYGQAVDEQTVTVDGTYLTDALREVKRDDILRTEQIHLAGKLKTIAEHTRPGTVIYTHYVDGMIEPLRREIEALNLRVGVFTGGDKTGLEEFKAGYVDVLIGSSVLREGIDGLQYVSNRVIVACPPWTHAAYEQLVGRFYRQGSRFDKVDIIIPQIVLDHNGDEWSWDRERMNRIRYKKTLADAAVDGVIPEGALEPQHVMLNRSLTALNEWIARLESAEELQPAT